MERINAEQQTQRTIGDAPRDRASGWFLAFTIMAAVAVLATAVFGVMLLVRATDDGPAAVETIATPEGQSAFILFDEFHTTLFVSPGVVGDNALDVVLARHDGAAAEDVTGVTVSVSQDGAGRDERRAEPVAGSPGTFRVSGLSFPSPGDWTFEVEVTSTSSDPVRDTAVIPIGERSGN